MSDRTRVTLPSLFARVAAGIPITWLTCYDYPTAVLQDQAGVDMILVGDSLGMTMLGYDSTLPVTMDDMVRHTAAVRRGAPNAWVIGDMPYMSYQPSVETAIRNAGRLMAETGCDAVKLEGGTEMADRVAGIARVGIPIMGHLGLTPQSAGALGGFRLQGKGAAQARRITDDAKTLEEAGAFSIVLELVPDRLCRLITERAEGCIIMGLGSGPHAHGQLQIFHDAFGLYPRFTPRMAKVFADAGAVIREGLSAYIDEVHAGTFPGPEHGFTMKDEEYDELLRGLAQPGGRT
ncbi:MAG TPA: 3-methyl-2-oxobutanoate hydroxymethyltransferase [Myxococcaceae bacterium]|nr:3-methyl-2-oxobutanoate hydroxymethyltransferase [Myxococcaceae bacterium]